MGLTSGSVDQDASRKHNPMRGRTWIEEGGKWQAKGPESPFAILNAENALVGAELVDIADAAGKLGF